MAKAKPAPKKPAPKPKADSKPMSSFSAEKLDKPVPDKPVPPDLVPHEIKAWVDWVIKLCKNELTIDEISYITAICVRMSKFDRDKFRDIVEYHT
jgi:hypothetical protein